MHPDKLLVLRREIFQKAIIEHVPDYTNELRRLDGNEVDRETWFSKFGLTDDWCREFVQFQLLSLDQDPDQPVRTGFIVKSKQEHDAIPEPPELLNLHAIHGFFNHRDNLLTAIDHNIKDLIEYQKVVKKVLKHYGYTLEERRELEKHCRWLVRYHCVGLSFA
jgi:hypothetical protein